MRANAFDVVSVPANVKVLRKPGQLEKQVMDAIGTYDIWPMISSSGKRSSAVASMFARTVLVS